MSKSSTVPKEDPISAAIAAFFGNPRARGTQLIDIENWRVGLDTYILRRQYIPPTFSVVKRNPAPPNKNKSALQPDSSQPLALVSKEQLASLIDEGRPYLPALLAAIPTDLTHGFEVADNFTWAPMEIVNCEGTSLLLMPDVGDGTQVGEDYNLVLRFPDDPDHQIYYPVDKTTWRKRFGAERHLSGRRWRGTRRRCSRSRVATRS